MATECAALPARVISCAVDGFLFGAAIDRRQFLDPRLLQTIAHARPAQLGKRPARNRHVFAHNDIRVGDEVELAAHRRCLYGTLQETAKLIDREASITNDTAEREGIDRGYAAES